MEYETTKVGFLDGMRGYAALWVLIGHAMILCNYNFPIISTPHLAVDLFMMISGFLMLYNYQKRQRSEAWQASSTWGRFWIRRFFRISPVYYAFLVIAWFSHDYYGNVRNDIASFFPTTATDPLRYSDGSLTNLLMHASYIFGFSPSYAYRTALPDWSIGLEMQFYMAFPFLALLWSLRGPKTASTIILISVGTAWLFAGNFLSSFPMPSFLGLKIHLFLIGMLMVPMPQASQKQKISNLAFALMLACIPCEGALSKSTILIRWLIIATIYALANKNDFKKWTLLAKISSKIDNILSSEFSTFLADMSYSVYLLHGLIMLPVVSWLLTTSAKNFPHIALTACCIMIVAPATYLGAYIMHITIEKPGIRAGHALISLLRSRHR